MIQFIRQERIAESIVEKSIDVLVVMRRPVRAIETANKTADAHIDKVVGVPLVLQRQTPTIQTEQKTIEVPQITCLEPLVDVPVVTQQTAEIPLIDRIRDVLVALQRPVRNVPTVQKTTEVPCRRYARCDAQTAFHDSSGAEKRWKLHESS